MAPFTLPLREALNLSIPSGRFTDTKIILYSRRDSSGTISKPRALYANSHVLKSVPYFSDLLSGTFAESELKDFSEPIDDDERAENYGYHSDSDLEDDEDTVNAAKTMKNAATSKKNTTNPLLFPANDKKPASICGEWKEPSGKGTIIKVHDVAFITFQAFLMYLYTGNIKFAPYGSEENRKSRSAEIVSPSEDSIPRPSPKSIYRLADKYDVPILKQLALKNIKNGLGRCDIVEEVFSEFSSYYEEFRIMHTHRLVSDLSHADEKSAEDMCAKIDGRIDRYSNGDLDYAVDAVTLLWKLSMAAGSPPSPKLRSELGGPLSFRSSRPLSPAPGHSRRSRSPPPPRCFSEADFFVSYPANRELVESALIKSIRTGMFFDRRYWARHSKTAKTLQPIHISSIVAGDKLRRINDMVKAIKEGEYSNAGEEAEDSDYEIESEQPGGSAPEERGDGEEEKEPGSLPVLTTGSFACWRSLFFYLYTDVIQFAPLQSQGANARAQYIQGQTTHDKPPPCSPKIIYSLAVALEVKGLRKLAFDDIKSKVTPENVVTELFSGFTSWQSDIARMQCGLLYYKFNNDTTASQGMEFIEGMLGGNSAHRANAVKLVLREGLLSGVFLRCPDEDCDLHNNTTPYHLLDLESGIMCPRHNGWGLPGPRVFNLVCSGCGTSRTGSEDTSCRGCRKRFR